ncbi:hypothetical protein BC629DRAFT_1445767 [Irpex lacteus]|nr:hypothetical protein BC629DRAFT_1445767 [Irpex lacteus]
MIEALVPRTKIESEFPVGDKRGDSSETGTVNSLDGRYQDSVDIRPSSPPPSVCDDEIGSIVSEYTSSSSESDDGIVLRTRPTKKIASSSRPTDVEKTMALTDAAIRNYQTMSRGFNKRMEAHIGAGAKAASSVPPTSHGRRSSTSQLSLILQPSVWLVFTTCEYVTVVAYMLLTRLVADENPTCWVVFAGFRPGIVFSSDAENCAVGFEGARVAAFASFHDAQRVWMLALMRGEIVGLLHDQFKSEVYLGAMHNLRAAAHANFSAGIRNQRHTQRPRPLTSPYEASPKAIVAFSGRYRFAPLRRVVASFTVARFHAYARDVLVKTSAALLYWPARTSGSGGEN